MKNARTFRVTFGLLTAISLVLVPAVARAQDALVRAKGYYESADYENALQLLDSLKGRPSNTEAAAYRVFCLVALGRKDEAKEAVEAIVRVDPLFRPSEEQVAPRLRSFFEDIRKPLLPEMARQAYGNGKNAFESRNWASALTSFDQVISLLNEIGTADQGVADLRTLAVGFKDLAKTALAPPKPEPTPTPTPTPAPTANKPATPAEPSIYGIEDLDVKRPMAVSKTMPEWRPMTGVEERQTFMGAVELVINETGKVLSVKLLDSVHPRYDPDLLKSAMNWTFRPATKNGVPVKYRYAVSVQLGK